MPRARPAAIYERLLLRPRALAGTAAEGRAAGACSFALILICVAEIYTPRSVVGALSFLPLLAASWLLSRHMAQILLVAAVVLLFLEVALHGIDLLTAAIEGLALVATTGIVRLYAERLELLFAEKTHPGLKPLMRRLTEREKAIVHLTVQGRTAPQVGKLLHISERTVESHLANAYAKLGVSTKLELVRRAARESRDSAAA